ncbi:hypothetical protein SAMN04515671_3990 [Nakamurella panacisegetis]|uniref:Uncharacterized protein n=1 Tax=Nakamurella panacisegetis TaxID=1090615 RepID=A0A1H0SAN8_9ACTN|nr:hypothetical protein [Nakamurella panacisegetis]SDP38725.1 hypothetical protein SAMN04515671_3990 [Nakamurella panacisegetis]
MAVVVGVGVGAALVVGAFDEDTGVGFFGVDDAVLEWVAGCSVVVRAAARVVRGLVEVRVAAARARRSFVEDALVRWPAFAVLCAALGGDASATVAPIEAIPASPATPAVINRTRRRMLVWSIVLFRADIGSPLRCLVDITRL